MTEPVPLEAVVLCSRTGKMLGTVDMVQRPVRLDAAQEQVLPRDDLPTCQEHGAGCADVYHAESRMFKVGLKAFEVDEAHATVSLQVPSTTAMILFASMVKLVKDAPNYVEAYLTDASGKAFVVTVQRREGRTPHELRRDAEARAESLERQLAQARGPA